MPMATVKRWLRRYGALVILVGTLLSSLARLVIYGWHWSTGGALAFHVVALVVVARLMRRRRKVENPA